VGTSSRVRDTFVPRARSKSAMSPFKRVGIQDHLCSGEVWKFVKSDVDFWVQLAPASPRPDRLEGRCCLGKMFLLVLAVESLPIARIIDLRTNDEECCHRDLRFSR